MNWKFFFGSSILVSGLLLKMGAPVETVAVGILTACLVSWWQARRRSRLAPSRIIR